MMAGARARGERKAARRSPHRRAEAPRTRRIDHNEHSGRAAGGLGPSFFIQTFLDDGDAPRVPFLAPGSGRPSQQTDQNSTNLFSFLNSIDFGNPRDSSLGRTVRVCVVCIYTYTYACPCMAFFCSFSCFFQSKFQVKG